MRKTIAFFALLSLPLALLGSEEEHHGHGSAKAIGPHKAITKVDGHKGFSLSPEAKKTIGLKIAPAAGKRMAIPQAAVVVSGEKKGVYRLRDGFFRLVSPESIKDAGLQVSVSLEDFAPGDGIVTGGAGLLRVADIYSTDESEYGHAH